MKQNSFQYVDLDKSSSLSDGENYEDVSDYEGNAIKFVFRQLLGHKEILCKRSSQFKFSFVLKKQDMGVIKFFLLKEYKKNLTA